MSIGIAATIGMIATVAAIVLLYVKVLPKRLKSSSYWSKLFNATKNFS